MYIGKPKLLLKNSFVSANYLSFLEQILTAANKLYKVKRTN